MKKLLNIKNRDSLICVHYSLMGVWGVPCFKYVQTDLKNSIAQLCYAVFY